MKQIKSILSWTLSAATLAVPAGAAAGHYSITAERIAAAVSSSGTQVSPDQVTLLTNVVASVVNPQLRVKSVDRSADQRAVARLECANPQQCLPFVVTLRTGADSAAPLSQTRLSAMSQGRPSPPIIRAGMPATLLLEGAHVHISISVICLESGAVGQTVRASTRDHHLFYTAQVVRDGVLEAKL